MSEWGRKQVTATFDPTQANQPWKSSEPINRAWLWKNQIEPWKTLEAQGVGVIVGEWGGFNQTPYPVTLSWMEDCLTNFKEAGWGWALWNLYGSFGILDSQRKGAVYEDYRGHQLDRKMVELLQRF